MAKGRERKSSETDHNESRSRASSTSDMEPSSSLTDSRVRVKPTPQPSRRSGSELFIVDNSDADWKVRSYLSEWCELASSLDIATGYFEIGALLALGGKWQAIDKIRILMGDEVSYRTKRAFAYGLEKIQTRLDGSLEGEKAQNDFLDGVPAIVEAIRSGKIQCRVYRKDKFHAKAYITHGRAAVVGSFALVGSSNFTSPGLSDNVELNVQSRGPEVGLLQEWYERHWDEAEDVTPDVLRTLERHTQSHSPFEVWFKALDEFFRGRELDPDSWDQERSAIFKRLDRYQQDAYRNLIQIAARYGGAFLCDGVGLGKTYVGLMLAERFVFKESKRVVLFAPKATREDVWEPARNEMMSEAFSKFVSLVVYNHTDLQRTGKWPREIQQTLRDADVIIIDEAHHFRNPGIAGRGVKIESRYRQLQDYLQLGDKRKQVFFLTATPINNSVHDFRHIIELFTGEDPGYFAETLGIHNLQSHFVQLERKILKQVYGGDQIDFLVEKDMKAAERVLKTDTVFHELVVQRSRAYVNESQKQHEGNGAIFPKRELPKVVQYSLKSTYGDLLTSVSTAFHKDKPLFVLGIYSPLSYWIGDKEDEEYKAWDAGRQKQVVMLIRTLFLKRFESSARAFEGSCYRLLRNLFAWASKHADSDHDKRRLDRWKAKYADLIGFVQEHQTEFWPEEPDEDQVEDFLTEDILNSVERLDPKNYDVQAIFEDTLDDMNQLADFLRDASKVEPKRDDKLKALVKLLKTDPVLKTQKVIIFSEFADTARYLERELTAAGIKGLHRIDGGSNQKHRSDVIHRFAPYYNGLSTGDLARQGKEEIRVLISTDVLSEGLNLQDATRVINYDLHWNPVRLMQRIGRVDRRLNPDVEKRLIADHPELATHRGKVAFWNFLPPDDLDELLRLFQRVTSKVLVISRTLGIEGRTLLRPDDEFDPIKELNEQCDGTISETEQLRLEYNSLVEQYPEVSTSLAKLPLKVFSGKASPKPESRAVFFCYRIPRPDPSMIEVEPGQLRWSDAAGFTVWACYDLRGERVLTESGAIADLIRSDAGTERKCVMDRKQLSELRKSVEKQIVTEYLRPLQAPAGITPILKCWMELN